MVNIHLFETLLVEKYVGFFFSKIGEFGLQLTHTIFVAIEKALVLILPLWNP